MIFCSFVSKNSPYEEIIKTHLLPSLKKWQLSYDIDYIENRGSWIANVQYKPEFIKKMLLKHKCPIISLDADAVIEKNPVLFEEMSNIDFGAHWLSWKEWYRKKEEKLELLGGTLYFNYNEKILNLVEKWIKLQQENKGWAQKNLQKLVEEDSKLYIYMLPVAYCFIETHKFPKLRKEARIVHHQKSRVWRNKKW